LFPGEAHSVSRLASTSAGLAPTLRRLLSAASSSAAYASAHFSAWVWLVSAPEVGAMNGLVSNQRALAASFQMMYPAKPPPAPLPLEEGEAVAFRICCFARKPPPLSL
jgi:hypothetical protein